MIEHDLDSVLNFDLSLWEDLRDKSIFATGCTGFIGSWIIYSFFHVNNKLQLNSKMTLLTRNKTELLKKFPFTSESPFSIVEGDVCNFEFPESKYQYIIHGATEVTNFQADQKRLEILDVSYLGTKRVIEFAKKKSTTKVLFLSSGAAYGLLPGPVKYFNEDQSFAPMTNGRSPEYGEAKRLGELLLFNEPAFSSVSARIFAASGPYLPVKSKFAFSNFIESCVKNEDIVISGDGKSIRSYLYAADLALWLWLLLIRGENKNIYNVGSDEDISILDLANAMKRVLGKELKINVLGDASSFSRYVPSNLKMRNTFKIQKTVSLDESIRKSYDFLKASYAI